MYNILFKKKTIERIELIHIHMYTIFLVNLFLFLEFHSKQVKIFNLT